MIKLINKTKFIFANKEKQFIFKRLNHFYMCGAGCQSGHLVHPRLNH